MSRMEKEHVAPAKPLSPEGQFLGSIILAKKGQLKKKGPADHQKFGWGKLTPNCLQCLNRPWFLLVCLSLVLTFQGCIMNGIIPASVTHLERRFHFSSSEIGGLSSVYDGGVVVMLFVILRYGTHSHKGRWIATGALLTGLSSVLITLPHFLAGPYEYGSNATADYCGSNASFSDTSTATSTSTLNCIEKKSTAMRWKAMFYVAAVLFGIASSPLSNIAIAYLDENVSQQSSGMFLNIYSLNHIIGPCIGYGLGAYLSRKYGYPEVDEASLPMKYPDPRWYGQWWVGVLAAGCVSCVLAIPMFGFSRELPGKDKLREKDVDEAHHGTFSLQLSQLSASMADFKTLRRQLKIILRNPTYLGLVFDQCATLFIVSGFTVFATKYLETQFSMSTAMASVVTASTAIPSTVVGVLLGTGIQRRLHLTCRGNILLAIVATVVATFCWTAFYWTCPTRPFAGVTSFLGNASSALHDVTEQCNSNCSCSLSHYDPHCWTVENISFFSKCHAGCDADKKHCACTGDASVVIELCETECGAEHYVPFLFGLGMLVLFAAMKKMPEEQAILRCVPHSLRTIALALAGIPIKLLGAIPATPFIGYILNLNCILWQEKCGEREVCILYDNKSLASHLQLTGAIGFSLSLISLLMARKFYKPPARDSRDSEPSIFMEAMRLSWR